MSDARKILRKIVANAYDDTAAGGDTFDLDAIREQVRHEAANASLGDQILDMAINDAVGYVDQSRRDEREDAGLFGDLDQVLATGDGVRRHKGSCRADDFAKHMAIVTANAAAVTAAASRKQAEYARVLPYLNDGMTFEEAAAAWRADNPEAGE